MNRKILISDRLHGVSRRLLEEEGYEVIEVPGVNEDRLAELCGDIVGWIIRSGTVISGELLDRARQLKVIGRAGVGVDNVDLEAATRRGVLVLNAPAGNTLSTSEHAVAMMLALARRIAPAAQSISEGRWERKKFTGTELYGKTVGIIGVGKVGRSVAERIAGFGVELIGYDPVLSSDAAERIGLSLVDLHEVISHSDFITIHAPLTPDTKHMLDELSLSQCKKGVFIVNCARGGIVDEIALLRALQSGQVAGAALDVFSSEPPEPSLTPLLSHPRVVATPHIAASTAEAQEKVAKQVTEQVIRALADEPVKTAVNAMAIRMAGKPEVRPFVQLAERLGRAAGQLVPPGTKRIRVRCHGDIPRRYTDVLRVAALRGLLSELRSEPVNFVNAPILADEVGLNVEVETFHADSVFTSLVELVLESSISGTLEKAVPSRRQDLRIAGTVFGTSDARITAIDDVDMELRMEGRILLYQNEDRPGMLAKVGSILAEANVNIASMALGREAPGRMALTAINVDSELQGSILKSIEAIPGIRSVESINF